MKVLASVLIAIVFVAGLIGLGVYIGYKDIPYIPEVLLTIIGVFIIIAIAGLIYETFYQ